MKIHTVFITYNRLELTKRAITSYLETVTVPHLISIVDNGSSDGTDDWIHDMSHEIAWNMHLFHDNHYPGYAANRAWELTPADITHLHRADNDFIFLPGWCEEVQRSFRHYRMLGQLGLRTNDEEQSSINVGGNCVIRRELWDKGLRWDERPWPQIRDEVGAGWTEDSLMSAQVRNMGYSWVRARKPCIQPISAEDPDDPYYQGTWADRGIVL